MNKTTEKLRELKNRLDKEADHFDNLINILNSDKSKEKIINDINSQVRRPDLSESIPNKGFRRTPVKVDIATISPVKISAAPSATANSGNSGDFPI